MSDPYERMKTSGIELPPCPRLAGSYAPGKIFGSLKFASGQTPTRDGVPAYRGRVGTDLGVEEGYAAARPAALNCVAELEAVCGDLRHPEGKRLRGGERGVRGATGDHRRGERPVARDLPRRPRPGCDRGPIPTRWRLNSSLP